MLRDGLIHGGNSFFYFLGTYSCFEGNWKGEMTTQEHSPAPAWRPMARRVVTLGFSGSYTSQGAEVSATALVGKQCIRYEAKLSLLKADD
jgi:hypothetical protein